MPSHRRGVVDREVSTRTNEVRRDDVGGEDLATTTTELAFYGAQAEPSATAATAIDLDVQQPIGFDVSADLFDVERAIVPHDDERAAIRRTLGPTPARR